jgi:tetratricopeptide (TPR) repeat protein
LPNFLWDQKQYTACINARFWLSLAAYTIDNTRPMAKKSSKQELDLLNNPEAVADAAIGKAEKFIQANGKLVSTVVGIIAGFILLAFGYVKFIQEPAELEAQDAIAPAQMAFERDSLRLALHGNMSQMGFLEVADTYSSTGSGELANYYAGLSFLGLGQPSDAIEAFDNYSASNEVLGAMALGGIGDAFAELNQAEEAHEYYRKAARADDNEFLSPFFLLKAGIAAEMIGDYREAKNHYQSIQSDYPLSTQAANIDGLIAYCEAKLAQ